MRGGLTEKLLKSNAFCWRNKISKWDGNRISAISFMHYEIVTWLVVYNSIKNMYISLNVNAMSIYQFIQFILYVQLQSKNIHLFIQLSFTYIYSCIHSLILSLSFTHSFHLSFHRDINLLWYAIIPTSNQNLSYTGMNS